MAQSKHRPNSSTSSSYNAQPTSLSNEYINIAPSPFKADGKAPMYTEVEENVAERSSINYLPPPFPPPGWDASPAVKQSFLKRNRKVFAFLWYIFLLALITCAFAAPVWYYRKRRAEERKGADNLPFHLSLWLLVSWGFIIVSNILINLLPYIFKLWAQWFNPGWVKYYRIFRFMRLASTLLGGAFGTYLSWAYIIMNDKALFKKAAKKPDSKSMDWDDILKNLAINANKKLKSPSEGEWQKIVNDVLTIVVIWAVLFFFEKMAMLFVSIHYHYRADGVRIEESKRRRNALVTLYEASTALFAPMHAEFRTEDTVIRDAKGSGKVSTRFLSRFSKTSGKVTVDHALEDQRASAALAKRVWASLVPEGRQVLILEDVVEVLGTHRRKEAQEAFSGIDTNENGDITLNEMVLTVLETGRTRRVVYQGMTDINKAINTLDWICCVLILMTVSVYGIVRYIPSLSKMKDAAGFAALGLTWGLGRSLYEFINGVIFIFFKHAYDVGDRIEVYNLTGTLCTSVVVTRISVLFTIFRRVDNGKDLQISNDRLNMKRIENVTRSGANREEVAVFVDFNTTFTDIQNLKSELQAFLFTNPRDYQPGCQVRVASIYEMNKLEIKVGFTHKSNWSNEELRAARSSKFMCALVAAIRRVPMARPGTIPAIPFMTQDYQEGAEEAAYRDLTIIPVTTENTPQGSNGHTASGAEISAWVGPGSTGIRRRTETNGSGAYYGT